MITIPFSPLLKVRKSTNTTITTDSIVATGIIFIFVCLCLFMKKVSFANYMNFPTCNIAEGLVELVLNKIVSDLIGRNSREKYSHCVITILHGVRRT